MFFAVSKLLSAQTHRGARLGFSYVSIPLSDEDAVACVYYCKLGIMTGEARGQRPRLWAHTIDAQCPKWRASWVGVIN